MTVAEVLGPCRKFTPSGEVTRQYGGSGPAVGCGVGVAEPESVPAVPVVGVALADAPGVTVTAGLPTAPN
jgi:hypothetical protein